MSVVVASEAVADDALAAAADAGENVTVVEIEPESVFVEFALVIEETAAAVATEERVDVDE